MKALTLTQPWASLVVLGIKRWETRSWHRGRVGRIAIHAAKGWTADDREYAAELHERGILPIAVADLPLGAVIGEVTVVGLVRTSVAARSGYLSELEIELGDYGPDRYAWELEAPVAYPVSRPVRGALGLWDWEPVQVEELRP